MLEGTLEEPKKGEFVTVEISGKKTQVPRKDFPHHSNGLERLVFSIEKAINSSEHTATVRARIDIVEDSK